MGWKQVLEFDKNKMGTKKGWCLQNCRLGYGIATGTYPSAKADMEAQKKEGTFHTTDLPNNVAVPVYFDTSSPNEHVMVDDHGDFYEDGHYVSSLAGYTILGWGEKCDGVRVVEQANEPAPQPVKKKKCYKVWVEEIEE